MTVNTSKACRHCCQIVWLCWCASQLSNYYTIIFQFCFK